ncbi:MAG: DEAD/DEAH box helicase [Actinomycetota bacterium]|nr:DEAD/DEAH box helicase [Actinomycetota bacterium]
MSTRSFAELGASKRTVEALEARDMKHAFDIQALVIPDAMQGRDVLAKSRTGSGKTLAFAVPIVELIKPADPRPSALVLVPTRELATQVTQEFQHIAKANGLKVAVAYGGVGLQDQARLASKSHILIATPGRLEDLADRKMINLDRVRILILDEADRMLDMGFQPQVDRIVRRIKGPRQTMFFSATLDGRVGQLATSYTKDAVLREVDSPKLTVEEVEHVFTAVTAGDKIGALVDVLRKDREHALVFVRTKRGADRLVLKLKTHGVPAVAMHGDMSQAARERSWSKFQSGRANVLVATDVAARGLDLDRISHVINFDPPEDEKAYVHRVGRTARAGRSGSGITLVTPEQNGDVGRIAARLDLNEQFEKDGLKVPAPAIAFTSGRGRKSMMGRRPRRRF